MRRNRDAVAPERRWRCAGTAMPLRRNGDAVAPERPPRCAGTAADAKTAFGRTFFFLVRRTSSLPLSRAWQASSFRLARLWKRPIPQRAAREEPPSTFSAFSTRLINHMSPPCRPGQEADRTRRRKGIFRRGTPFRHPPHVTVYNMRMLRGLTCACEGV